MDAIIEVLQKRYGSKRDYNLLTEQQKKLLMDPRIKDQKDPVGDSTVGVGEITDVDGLAVLCIRDTWSYGSSSNRQSPADYAQGRRNYFIEILGVEPVKREGKDQIYEFPLEDSKVIVRFDSLRDSA